MADRQTDDGPTNQLTDMRVPINDHARLLVGWSVCHEFLKRQVSDTYSTPIGAFLSLWHTLKRRQTKIQKRTEKKNMGSNARQSTVKQSQNGRWILR